MLFSHRMKETHNILPKNKKTPVYSLKAKKVHAHMKMSNKIIFQNA